MATLLSAMGSSAALFIVYMCLLSTQEIQAQNRTFVIDRLGNTFLKDGKPFRYISGSIHYSRIPRYYWRDRLMKMYIAGLDAAQVYIPWNFHAPEENVTDFEGDKDLVTFFKTAQEVGLLIVLRAGPYICGEWDFGGIPAWILQKNPKTVVRTMDPTYIKYVDKWFDVLLPKIKPLLYHNGGPILMVQPENEYGSFAACDHDYMTHLVAKMKEHLGEEAVLFTTDGNGDQYLKCGTVEGAYATIDFGPSSADPERMFKPQRDFEKFGPLVNSEFYTGWLDYWGHPHSTSATYKVADALDKLLAYGANVNSEFYTGWLDHWGHPHSTSTTYKVADALDKLLAYGANVNMYMFEGGTNFGFWSGADPTALFCPTSYDYDAPLTEAGDPTDKYISIRQVVSKYNKLPDMPIPPPTPKAAYGKVQMTFTATIQDALPVLCPKGPIKSDIPLTMEAIGQYQGFVLYRHVLRGDTPKDPKALDMSGVRDRAMLMLDKVPQVIFDRNDVKVANITLKVNQVIDILVENMGHMTFGSEINDNLKGLISNVTFGGSILSPWEIYPISMDNFKATDLANIQGSAGPITNGNLSTPSFYMGKLNIPNTPTDTYLDMSNWQKGQAFINNTANYNLGRYWPYIGPQVRLYVPKPFLTAAPQVNYVMMFELEKAPCDSPANCYVDFMDQPLVNGTAHGPTLRKDNGYDFPYRRHH